MRKLTQALLSGAYLCLSLIVALLLLRVSGGVAGPLAGLIGALALCYTAHNLFSRARSEALLKAEIASVRDAHAILITQLERIDARLTEVVETVTDDALRRSEELSSEVHMLEDLVERLGERIEGRFLEVGHGGQGAMAGARRMGFPVAPPANHLLDEIKDALADNRIDLYLQPVVSLPQRRVVFYEGFSRLRDATGRIMMPAEYLAVAEPEGLVAAIDNLLLFRCVQIVRRLAKQDRKIGIFCNISLASLSDEVFFPQFLEFLQANKDLGGALIFEMGQGAFDQRGPVEARHMARLADLGFQFSLDKVFDLDLDFQDLARADVKYIKIGAQLLLEQLTEQDGRMILRSLPDLQAADFAALTRRYGLEIIAEKVESERQIVDVLELNIGYGQGHLFGEPRAIRDAVLAESGAPPPADFMRASLRRRAAVGR
jgi:cyclic-di-GMP phosphodiesterase TipF (flagellum assembly factor)